MNITQMDVYERLIYRKRHWFHGPPHVKLIGKEKSFGILQFDFGDEIVSYDIYINDRNAILNVSCLAVLNSRELETERRHNWEWAY